MLCFSLSIRVCWTVKSSVSSVCVRHRKEKCLVVPVYPVVLLSCWPIVHAVLFPLVSIILLFMQYSCVGVYRFLYSSFPCPIVLVVLVQSKCQAGHFWKPFSFFPSYQKNPLHINWIWRKWGSRCYWARGRKGEIEGERGVILGWSPPTETYTAYTAYTRMEKPLRKRGNIKQSTGVFWCLGNLGSFFKNQL